jgi:hypothetical protein
MPHTNLAYVYKNTDRKDVKTGLFERQRKINLKTIRNYHCYKVSCFQVFLSIYDT